MPVIDDIGEHQHMQAVNTGIYQTKKKKIYVMTSTYIYIYIYLFIYLLIGVQITGVLVKNIIIYHLVLILVSILV